MNLGYVCEWCARGQCEKHGSEVRVAKLSSEVDGGCNGCTKYTHDSEGRLTQHFIYRIRVRGCSIRVCEQCKDLVVAGLKGKA
jgi:hypothetical protein